MTVDWAADGAVAQAPRPSGNGAVPAAAQPHLIIGLGGIGRRAVAELRRTLDRPFGSRAALDVPMGCLLIDMEGAPRAPADVPSSLLGGDGEDRLVLDMASLLDFADHLPDEVRQWLRRHEAAEEIGSSTAADLRRLGSLLLAAKADRLQELLDVHAGDLMPPGDSAGLCVHVVGYLAGGVGSGVLTQLLDQLRRNRLMAGRCHVILYGLPSDGVSNTTQGRDVTAEKGEAGSFDEIQMIPPTVKTGHMARDVRALPEALAMIVRQRLFTCAAAGELPVRAGKKGRPAFAVAPLVISTAADEAEEALSISLLQAALNQLIYAHWRPDRGFLGESRTTDHAAYLARAEVQSAWLLSAEHLIQSVPILDSDAVDGRWRRLSEDWCEGPAESMEPLEAGQRKDWLDILADRWERRFREGFRGGGVAAFYSGRHARRRDMARAIRGRIEQSLFGSWRDGEIGLACARATVDTLIVLQRERLAAIDDRVADIREAEEACRVRAAAIRQKWAGQRSWRAARREAVALVNDYAVALQQLFLNRTRAEGWLFAKALLPMVIEELDGLHRSLDRLIGIFSQGARGADLMLEGLSARLEQGEEITDSVQQLFDRRKLRHFARDMLIDETAQQDYCRQARHILARHATAGDAFQSVAGWVESHEWMGAIAALGREQIVGAEGLWTAEIGNILGGSIYKALQERTDGDFGRLRDLAAMLTGRAISRLPETAQSEAPIRIHVLLPRDPGQEAFIRTLKSAFAFSRRHDISFIDVDDCCDRLSILAAAAPGLVPEAEFLGHIERGYSPHVDRDSEYARFALPASRGGELPAAPRAGARTGEDSAAALLLIGLPLELVAERFGTGPQPARLWLIPKRENGVEDQPIAIADDLLNAPEQMSPALISLLEDNVERALAAFTGDREHLVRAIVEWIVKIRALCRDNSLDETARIFIEAGKSAVARVRRNAGKAFTND